MSNISGAIRGEELADAITSASVASMLASYQTKNLVITAVSADTGTTVSVNSADVLVINNGDTILALTVVLPAAPADGKTVAIATRSIVTGLTLSGGTILGALTAGTANGFAQYCFSSVADSWVRVG